RIRTWIPRVRAACPTVGRAKRGGASRSRTWAVARATTDLQSAPESVPVYRPVWRPARGSRKHEGPLVSGPSANRTVGPTLPRCQGRDQMGTDAVARKRRLPIAGRGVGGAIHMELRARHGDLAASTNGRAVRSTVGRKKNSARQRGQSVATRFATVNEK